MPFLTTESGETLSLAYHPFIEQNEGFRPDGLTLGPASNSVGMDKKGSKAFRPHLTPTANLGSLRR